MADAPDQLDPKERAREKRQSREADARALASGEKSRADLRRENGHFAFAKVRVSLRRRKAPRVTDLAYVDVRAILVKLADLERELILVGGQAVNFWASYYERRVAELARDAPFTSKDIDFCGDQRAVRVRAARLGGTARIATFDDASPNSGTVVFVDAAGVKRTLDVVRAPFGLDAGEVHATALPVDVLDDTESATTFFVIHPVLSMESRVHNASRGCRTRTIRNRGASSFACRSSAHVSSSRTSSTAEWTRLTRYAQS